MRRKLWPKVPAKEGALGQMSKNFQVYFIHINFFQKPNLKNLQQSQRDILRCFFLFFIVKLPKKMKSEKWPKAADSPLYDRKESFKIVGILK